MNTGLVRTATVVVFFLCGSVISRGQQAGSGDAPVFRSTVELVAVDVGVVDKQGEPVRGLAASDFRVTVDGEPRRIVTSELIDTIGDRERATREAERVPTSSNEGAAVGRQFVVIVDQNTLGQGELRRVAEAGSRLFSRLSFADRSALMRLPNGPDVTFTWAHERIQDAFRRTIGAGTFPTEGEFASLSEARDIATGVYRGPRMPGLGGCDALPGDIGQAGAMAGGAGNQGSGTSSPGTPSQGGQAGSSGSGPGASSPGASGLGASGLDDRCTSELKARAVWTWQNAEMTSRASLGALRGALSTLSRVPGDKTVIVVSGGWPLDPSEEHFLIAQVAEEAARARATIFTLFVPPTLAANMRRVPSLTPVDDQQLHVGPLETLAGLTGGMSFRAHAGADAAFERIARETAAYYRIGVEKGPGDSDGRRRQLAVRVLRPGTTVRARQVFDTRTYEDRDWTARLASALDSPLVATSIALRVTSYVAADPGDSGKFQVMLAGEASRVRPGDATFKVLVRDLEGNRIASGEQPVGQPTEDGLVFSTRLPLAPGSYVVRVALMDGSGRTGSVDHRVEVRDEAIGDVRATGPILVRVPVDAQGPPRLALAEARRDERLAMQIQLSGDEQRLTMSGVTFEIAGSADGPPLVGAPANLSSGPTTGSVVAQAVADLRVLPPGRYVVRARVTADGRPLGQLHRALVVTGIEAAPHTLATSTAGRAAPVANRRPDRPLLATGARFDPATALAPPVLSSFLDRVAVRPDAGAPPIRDLVDRARAVGVRQLTVSETLAAEQPVAAFLSGLTLLSRHDLDPAADAFRRAMRIAPDLYPAMVYLGVCYAAGGKDKEAAAAWRTALIKEGESRAVHLLLTDALLRQQQGDLALQAVERALARWPADDELRRRYVMAALLAGRDAEGLQALDELVETNAADTSTLATGLLVLYESFQRGDPVQEVEQDRARMARLADAYRTLGGPSMTLIEAWLEAAGKR